MTVYEQIIFAARIDGRLAGNCELYQEGDDAQVEHVGTLERFRGQGVARSINLETIRTRIGLLAAAINVDSARLRDWCRAFAGMVTLELASEGNAPPARIDALHRLAQAAIP